MPRAKTLAELCGDLSISGRARQASFFSALPPAPPPPAAPASTAPPAPPAPAPPDFRLQLAVSRNQYIGNNWDVLGDEARDAVFAFVVYSDEAKFESACGYKHGQPPEGAGAGEKRANLFRYGLSAQTDETAVDVCSRALGISGPAQGIFARSAEGDHEAAKRRKAEVARLFFKLHNEQEGGGASAAVERVEGEALPETCCWRSPDGACETLAAAFGDDVAVKYGDIEPALAAELCNVADALRDSMPWWANAYLSEDLMDDAERQHTGDAIKVAGDAIAVAQKRLDAFAHLEGGFGHEGEFAARFDEAKRAHSVAKFQLELAESDAAAASVFWETTPARVTVSKK